MLKSQSFQSQSLPFFITLLLLGLWAASVYRSTLNQFPSHIHAWTQSDRYALTIGYLDNGFSLFKPATPNLWPKYPPQKLPDKLEGVTKADLPLTEFLSAQLMRLFASRQPIFHRGLNMFFALSGLMFLFGLAIRMGAALPMAWLSISFALLSPVFAYYLDGFIPAIPSIGLVIAAYYFFYRYAETQKNKFFLLSSFLATLAALIRPPFFMVLPAIMLALVFIPRRIKQLSILVTILISLGTFLLFQLYNKHLATAFGSLFISQLMPARDLPELRALLLESIQKWKFEYFSPFQYLLITVAFVLLIIFRHKLRSTTPRFALLMAALLHLAASVAYFAAMARQFPDHDYYFLESFFLPVVLIVSIGFSLPVADKLLRKFLLGVAFMLSAWLMADSALASREWRYTSHPWDTTEITRKLFEDSAAWLDKLGIGRDAKILVLDSYTTNAPLLLLDRKGFTVINTTRQNLEESLHRPFDYIIIPNRSLGSDVLRNLPELSGMLQAVANNGRIGLYRLAENNDNKPHNDLFLPLSSQRISWLADSVVVINPETEFFELVVTPYSFTENMRALAFDASISTLTSTVKDLHLVVDISKPEANLFYDSFRLDPYFENTKQDVAAKAFMNLVNLNMHNATLRCYLWNAGHNHIVLKHYSLDILHFENLKIHKNEKH